MNEYYKTIPAEYFILRESFLSSLLEQMPVVKKGLRGSREVLRVYEHDRKHYMEISRSNRNWSKIHSLHSAREKTAKMLYSVKRILAVHHRQIRHANPEVINISNRYDSAYYDSLREESCKFENETDYFYNGRHFRSRAEMILAEVLDELGLEYKYDVVIGNEYTVDFVIIFREFNRCIFIEFFGKCNSPSYNHDNSVKTEYYFNEGIYIGRDLYIFSGDINYVPGADVIRSQIISVIDQLVCYHVRNCQK